jgi:predicted ribosomally synthesized peptide with nif11-like leader
MSLESAKAFVAKIQQDETFAKSFFALSAPEARKDFIKEAGFEFTKEEIDQAREGIDASGGANQEPFKSCDIIPWYPYLKG